MSQHLGLDVDLQSGRADVKIVPDHPGRRGSFGSCEILVSLHESCDIDCEMAESFRPITDGKRDGRTRRIDQSRPRPLVAVDSSEPVGVARFATLEGL
jgi:hypothetical protein